MSDDKEQNVVTVPVDTINEQIIVAAALVDKDIRDVVPADRLRVAAPP